MLWNHDVGCFPINSSRATPEDFMLQQAFPTLKPANGNILTVPSPQVVAYRLTGPIWTRGCWFGLLFLLFGESCVLSALRTGLGIYPSFLPLWWVQCKHSKGTPRSFLILVQESSACKRRAKKPLGGASCALRVRRFWARRES